MKDGDCLDVLCCLLDSGRLSVGQLAARMGESPPAVRGLVHLLETYNLVQWLSPRYPEEVYEATLLVHPDWVTEAVREHCRR